jgi:hypothetical protein
MNIRTAAFKVNYRCALYIMKKYRKHTGSLAETLATFLRKFTGSFAEIIVDVHGQEEKHTFMSTAFKRFQYVV